MEIIFDIVTILPVIAAFAVIVPVFRKKLEFFTGVLVTAGMLVLSSVVSMYGVKVVYNVDIITASMDEFFIGLEESVRFMQDENMRQILERFITDQLASVKTVYTTLFPAFLILNILSCSYALYMIIKLILPLFRVNISSFPKFSQLRLSRSSLTALAVCYVSGFLFKNTVYAAAFSNISVIIFGVAVFCGLSLTDFNLRRRTKSAWFRFIIYIALFFITASGLGIVALGLAAAAIADVFFDFRRLDPSEVENDGK